MSVEYPNIDDSGTSAKMRTLPPSSEMSIYADLDKYRYNSVENEDSDSMMILVDIYMLIFVR